MNIAINNPMSKRLAVIGMASLGLITTSSAVTVSLDLPSAGNHASGTVFSTSVSTTDGASFNINYTLGATANNADAFVISDGTNLGVGTPTGNTTAATLGGNGFNGGGNGLSFTSLTISNFMAGSVVLTTNDISNLQFDTLTLSGAGNDFRDGGLFSFGSFDDNDNGTNLENATDPFNIDLSTLATQPVGGLATGLFVEPDSGQNQNVWSVSGLTVSFDVVPEPSTTALLGLGGLALILRRRK